MLKIVRNFVLLFSAAILLAACQQGGGSGKKSKTLDNTKKAGCVKCGVSQGLPGFSNADASGNWTGVDVDLCRAVAAATLGDSGKVKFFPLDDAGNEVENPSPEQLAQLQNDVATRLAPKFNEFKLEFDEDEDAPEKNVAAFQVPLSSFVSFIANVVFKK